MAATPETPRKVLAKRSINSPGPYARAQASPQIKAALAAARKKKSSQNDTLADWGQNTVTDAIEQAKTTGKLNLTAQQLDAWDPRIFKELLSRESRFHPDRHANDQDVDFDFDAAGKRTMWYEQVELRHVNVPSNQFSELPEQIGGFAELETLDLQANRLQRLPDSLVCLTLLTVLNLSSNALVEFPTPLLSLRALRDLNLSNNKLDSLWTDTWRIEVDILESSVKATSPSATPESGQPLRTKLFWGQASPSEPAQRVQQQQQQQLSPGSENDDAPFPRLRTLRIADNRLRHLPDSWPRSLVTLDLAGNGLRQVDLRPFARMNKLQELNLASNAIVDADMGSLNAAPADRFPLLRHLDLSLNGFETLEHLESAFTTSDIDYVGLPKQIANIVAAERRQLERTEGRPRLTVRIAGNTLVDEQDRRRSRYRDKAVHQIEEPEAGAASPAVEQVDELTSNLESSTLIDAPEGNYAAQLVEPEVLDDVVTSLLSRFDGQGQRLDLSGLDMDDLPVRERIEDGRLDSVKELDLSKNRLVCLKMSVLAESWTWQNTLTTLVVRNCKLSALESGVVLPQLERLDLAMNDLSDSPAVFDVIARSAPALRALDLSQNKLVTLDGIHTLFGQCRSFETVRFKSNKIANVEDLGRAAKDGLIRPGTTIDLEENEIARLPIEFGHVPLGTRLLVGGNTFRVPRRDVYEGAGDKFISWLRDRL